MPERQCETCGRELPERRAGPGRPRTRCDGACTEVASALATLERYLPELRDRMTSTMRRRVRAWLWRLACMLNVYEPRTGAYRGLATERELQRAAAARRGPP